MTFAALLCTLGIFCLTATAFAVDATSKNKDAKSSVSAKTVSVVKEITPKKKLIPFTYDYAHRETIKTGKPLLIFVGAEWCGACVQMKNNVIPDLKKSRLLKKVAFATVDFDRNRKLGRKLTNGGPIPQTILFCKDKKGWHSHKLIGGQSLASVESLIKESLTHAPKAEEKTVAGQETRTR